MLKQSKNKHFQRNSFCFCFTSLTWFGNVGGTHDIECAPSADDNWSNESKNIHNGLSLGVFSNKRLKWFVNWDNSTGIILSDTWYR
jgi:hypothetical protein